MSKKDTADYTGMVSCRYIGSGENMRMYILPHPINQHLDFTEIIKTIGSLVNAYGGKYSASLFIEDAMLQAYLAQHLKHKGYHAVGIKTHGLEKRTRFIMTTNQIKSGQILFPEQGAESLIKQMLNFGVEKHEDLVDGFTTLVQGLQEGSQKKKKGQAAILPLIREDPFKKRMPRNGKDWGRFLDRESDELYGRKRGLY